MPCNLDGFVRRRLVTVTLLVKFCLSWPGEKQRLMALPGRRRCGLDKRDQGQATKSEFWKLPMKRTKTNDLCKVPACNSSSISSHFNHSGTLQTSFVFRNGWNAKRWTTRTTWSPVTIARGRHARWSGAKSLDHRNTFAYASTVSRLTCRPMTSQGEDAGEGRWALVDWQLWMRTLPGHSSHWHGCAQWTLLCYGKKIGAHAQWRLCILHNRWLQDQRRWNLPVGREPSRETFGWQRICSFPKQVPPPPTPEFRMPFSLVE